MKVLKKNILIVSLKVKEIISRMIILSAFLDEYLNFFVKRKVNMTEPNYINFLPYFISSIVPEKAHFYL